MKAINLRTEYLIDPMPLDILQPRFFWHCSDGVRQSAYQIIAERGGMQIWDSGKVKSSRMTHIRYAGLPLASRDEVVWRVRLWDEQDQPGDWSPARFEIGLLSRRDWQARWITGNYQARKDQRYPVDCFQKKFILDRPVRKARLYITACGLYEARINGVKAGQYCLAPGSTDYSHRIQYQTYDVTDLLTSQNRLEIQLADGWYRGSVGCYGVTSLFGRQTALLCQLEVTAADGSRQIIASDDSFSWSNDGPIRFADLKDGEIYDAFCQPSYSGSALVISKKLMPVAANNVPIVEKERFQACLITTPAGKKLLDFGQNLAGFLEFSVHGQAGQRIRLRCGETLDEQGELTLKPIQQVKAARRYGPSTQFLILTNQLDKVKGDLVMTPLQEVDFICSGQPDYYKTTFAIFGFRYAEISTDVEIDARNFHAIAVYSDLEPAGQFNCSNQLLNRFFENTVWSLKSNIADLPTDCPTRERLGWTGDAQIFFNTATDLMNVAPLFRKWLLDMADGQLPEGIVPAVVPYSGMEMLYNGTGASIGFADAVVLIPYRFWKRYGDAEIIREHYPMMRRFGQFLIRQSGAVQPETRDGNPYADYVYEQGMHLGEWLEPPEIRDRDIGARDNRPEECTAYLYYSLKILAEIAACLGELEDEKVYAEFAAGAKKAYNWLFVQNDTIDTDRQAKLVRPLALGLLDGQVKRNVQERLATAVAKNDWRVGTGFLSTSFLLPVLTEAGFVDAAYKMLENENPPGWLAEVRQGATSVWENWDGEASRNHYTPGSVCDWLFTTVGGIRIIGENAFQIAPQPGGTLDYASLSWISPYGHISSNWKKTADGYQLIVSLPPNTQADIILPNGEIYQCISEREAFVYDWQELKQENNNDIW